MSFIVIRSIFLGVQVHNWGLLEIKFTWQVQSIYRNGPVKASIKSHVKMTFNLENVPIESNF